MGIEYQAVQWNRQKRWYDLALAGGVVVFLAGFALVTLHLFPFITPEILVIRTSAAGAFMLLHIILCIGPLCRLNPKFLPLLYNRRHAGVMLFLLVLVHACMVIATYHAGGNTNPFLNIFVSSPLTHSVAGVPFQVFGFFAFLILFLMAATSHDFWLANLGAPVWKCALHMLVYSAYALLVLHVTFGALQGELSGIYVAAMTAGLVLVLGLHTTAALREKAVDREMHPCHGRTAMWMFVPSRIFRRTVRGSHCLSGERVAVFKYGNNRISAVSNVCQHQNGPLGEGKIVDGCITCPWHGYQYLPDTGASPPPFVERVPTFKVRISNGRVLIHPRPNLGGHLGEPAIISGT